ncbi:hypothetical protein [Georgenia sp. SUBG003]|uniref:hypothetical protein n=1 Tax=Georgenia sp. SUBG003 TaxID=1497974 RepID=UPI003AB5EC05
MTDDRRIAPVEGIADDTVAGFRAQVAQAARDRAGSVGEQAVDACGDGVAAARRPQPAQRGAQVAHRLQLGFVVGARPGELPARHERVEIGRGHEPVLADSPRVDQRRSGAERDLGVAGEDHLDPCPRRTYCNERNKVWS